MVHASKYGSTQRYAEWIGEALGAPVKPVDEITAHELAQQDAVVFCSAIYGPALRGIADLRRAMELGTSTRWVLATVGLSDPELSTRRDELVAAKFSPPLRERLSVIHLRGAMDRSRLSVLERSMMATIRRSLSAKVKRTPEDEAMLAALRPTAIDLTDRAAIDAVVEACLG